jgi:large exoprotein involved in heme utilization and adhesion
LAGRIEIASVGENSLVSLTSLGQGWQLGYENVLSYRDITIADDAAINASGKDGTVHLQGRKINLNSGGRLINAPIDKESTGSIILNGSESVQLGGEGLEQLTGVFTAPEEGTGVTGDSGDVVINTPQLLLENGAILDMTILGDGQGGDLIVNASESVSIIGVGQSLPSYISSSVRGDESNPIAGNGGKLTINTQRLTVADGGLIFAVAVFTTGQGGNIVINASESVHVFGQGNSLVDLLPSQITATSGLEPLFPGGNSKAGDVQINTPQLTVEKLALISAGSFKSQSVAGNIQIRANTIVLDHGGKLTTESTSATGGNIVINATDSISLYNNSLITAESIGAGGRGDGGNINLTTPFIFAVPNQNSDIKANAGQGNGGNVTINASGLFGIKPRPQSTSLSDITASSKTGLSGVIAINGAEVDPQSGLVNQDTDVVDTKNLITQTCGTGGKFASGEFTITGRSGLPIDPNQITGIPQGLPDFGTTPPTEANLTPTKPPKKAPAIVEAQGWTVNQVGEIVLVATAEPGNPLIPTSCLP